MEDYGIEMSKNIFQTVIIPTRNEEDYIETCINSLIDDWVISTTEFLIVDGRSTDRTLEIVKEKFAHLNLKILDNPNLYQSYAMNIGIKNSSSKDSDPSYSDGKISEEQNEWNGIIIRADAHCNFPPNYIRNCRQAIRDNMATEGEGVLNMGSIQKSIGSDTFTKAVATVMNSKYGMGGVKYRKSNYKFQDEKLIPSDTAYLGAWMKGALENALKDMGQLVYGKSIEEKIAKAKFQELWRKHELEDSFSDNLPINWEKLILNPYEEPLIYNEEFQINEDYELNIRINNASNSGVVVNTEQVVDYFVRNSLFGLIKQFFRYGLWKTKTLSIHPDSLKVRQLAPVLFVLFLTSLAIGNLILLSPSLAILNGIAGIVGLLWIIMILVIFKDSPKIINILLIPTIVLSMHISWGLGFLFGLLRWAKGGWNKF